MYINRIPKELLSDKKLGVYERMLYIAILLNSPDGQSPVRTEELMRSAGFRSRNTLKKYLRVLADKGWVEIIEQKRDRASWLTIIARNPVLDARGRELVARGAPGARWYSFIFQLWTCQSIIYRSRHWMVAPS